MNNKAKDIKDMLKLIPNDITIDLDDLIEIYKQEDNKDEL
jgi:hypothetical protein